MKISISYFFKFTLYSMLFVFIPMLSACDGPRPAHISSESTMIYSPNSTGKLFGRIALGIFEYKPFKDGLVKFDNYAEITTGPVLDFDNPIAEHVKRVTGIELYHMGVEIDQEAPLVLVAEVLELKADNAIIPVYWSYAVEYRLLNRQTMGVVYSVRTPLLKAESPAYVMPAAYADVLNGLFFAGYEYFILDNEARRLIQSSK